MKGTLYRHIRQTGSLSSAEIGDGSRSTKGENYKIESLLMLQRNERKNGNLRRLLFKMFKGDRYYEE